MKTGSEKVPAAAARTTPTRPDASVRDLVLPPGARGVVVLFAPRGSGTGPEGTVQAVVDALRSTGVGTVEIDPVADGAAEACHEHRFEVRWMADRLTAVLDRLASDRRTRALPVGCLATGTAGGAALRAATQRHGLRAVVVLEGRPDLAGAALEKVKAPTLLVVAGLDTPLLRLNHQALRRLKCAAMLEVVPGAMHGLDDPRAQELALARIVDWLCTHLGIREPGRCATGFAREEQPLLLIR